MKILVQIILIKEKGVNILTLYKGVPHDMKRLKTTSVLNVVINGSVNKRLLFFRLKTVNLVLKNTQGAESLVKLYETKLCEEEAVMADKNNIENLMGTLKVRVGRCLFMGKSKINRKIICLVTPGFVMLYCIVYQ